MQGNDLDHSNREFWVAWMEKSKAKGGLSCNLIENKMRFLKVKWYLLYALGSSLLVSDFLRM